MTVDEFRHIAENLIGKPCLVTIKDSQEPTECSIQYERKRWYICQDEIEGNECENRFGHAFSYEITGENDARIFHDLKLREPFISEDDF
jgi:hypothetical protein